MKSLRRLFLYIAAVTFIGLLGFTVASRFLGSESIVEAPPPNSVIVSKSGGGQFKTISEAIAAVKPDMKILVRPGVYKEKIIINRPVEIVADKNGTDQAVTIEATGESCIVMQTGMATVRGLTLKSPSSITGQLLKFLNQRNVTGEPCIDVTRGEFTLEDCDIMSEAVAGMGIQGADNKLIVRRCKIHSGNSNGIWFADHAEGSVEDSEIFGTNWAGVRVEDSSRTYIRRCKIYDIRNCGVLVTDDAKATIEDCEIYNNSKSGVEIRDGSSVAMLNCKIHDQGEHGVWFHRYSTGTVEDCEIFANHSVALQIMENCNPVVSRCDIFGTFVTDVEINKGADPVIKNCKIHDGRGSGIHVYDNGEGTIEDCEVFGHQKYQGVVIRGGSKPILRRCNIHHESVGGVLALGDAEGRFEECQIYDNVFSGVWVRQSARLFILKCKITGNSTYGIIVHDDAAPTVEDCELTPNKLGSWDVQPQCQVRKARNIE